jgi:RNA polymerase sigma-70 factor, ECF subfamily
VGGRKDSASRVQVDVEEERLVAKARSGSREAAHELVLLHWPTIWRIVFGMTGRAALAEEIAQETFTRAFAALHRFDADRPLGPWLRRIAVNRTIDELRRERRLELVDAEAAEAPYEQALPDDTTIEAVRALDPARRAVVVLRFWLDWSLEQIAESLDIPVGTVSSRLSRALAELREEGGESDACSA